MAARWIVIVEGVNRGKLGNPNYDFSEPDWIVTVFPPARRFAIAVEVRRDPEGGPPFTTGIGVRRHHWAAGGWEGERAPVSARELQRLPVYRAQRAAEATAARLEVLPKGAPRPGSGPAKRWVFADMLEGSRGSWTDWIAAAADELEPIERGPRRDERIDYDALLLEAAQLQAELDATESIPKALAARHGVSVNTMNQRLHRARRRTRVRRTPDR